MNKIKEELWIAKDKDETVHFSNCRLVKPSELYPENPNANPNIFIPLRQGYHDNGSMIFSIIIQNDSSLIPKDLTFENSPKRIINFITE